MPTLQHPNIYAKDILSRHGFTPDQIEVLQRRDLLDFAEDRYENFGRGLPRYTKGNEPTVINGFERWITPTEFMTLLSKREQNSRPDLQDFLHGCECFRVSNGFSTAEVVSLAERPNHIFMLISGRVRELREAFTSATITKDVASLPADYIKALAGCASELVEGLDKDTVLELAKEEDAYGALWKAAEDLESLKNPR